jgi:hypothetical protein
MYTHLADICISVFDVDMDHSNMDNFSEATRNTISNIKRTRALSYTIESFTYHDNTSPGYEWLPPAWVAEERRGMTGRVYTVTIKIF